MAGLYIRELIMRADARRILIVVPGSLVDQWRDELFEKFGLEFPVYSPLLEQASPSGNPFEDRHQLIVRLDQLARNEALQDKLCAAGWDVVVFDEAHKLAAHYYGTDLVAYVRSLSGEVTWLAHASGSREMVFVWAVVRSYRHDVVTRASSSICPHGAQALTT